MVRDLEISDDQLSCKADLQWKEIRDLLRHLFKWSGMSTVDLAARMHKQPITVYKMLARDGTRRVHGHKKPKQSIKLDTLVAFAEAAGFDVNLVFTRKTISKTINHETN